MVCDCFRSSLWAVDLPCTELGYTEAAEANLMTVPAYACAFVLMFISSYSSDYFRDRGRHTTTLMSISAVAYALLATLPESNLQGM